MNDLLAAALCYFGFHDWTAWKNLGVWRDGVGWALVAPLTQRRDCQRCLAYQIEEVVE